MRDANPAPDAVRLLFVDDNEILCGTMAREVSRLDGCKCMSWTTPSAQPTREIADFAPDMVVADPCQTETAPGALRETHLNMFGDHESVAYIPSDASGVARECLRADYSGIISRGEGLDCFIRAIESMIAGGVYIDGVFGQFGANTLSEDRTSEDEDGLSAREREILIQVAKGRAAKEIARTLRISPKTVETYKYRAMNKLGLSGRGAVYDFAEGQAWLA
ncbi:response regulator transcription factor [Maritimibacter sp. UBA3975]|uniref:helix-turn-helix transcriptional regulator n=1 Tax=Maritimibacter sp. UBA3975 TaxID=1946833 RepID=UPI0025C4221B|nr:response regulator transcription factor [Maritimibacter sp. UBA3975]|tara:strand:+ start:24435 stop:25094 length:660 start_codon:yes stop_codon:yes gene_type:complete